MKKELADAKKLSQLLEKADSHPLMKAILAEETVATLAKRKQAAEKIRTLKKKRDESIPSLQAELTEKETQLHQAKTALDAATAEFSKAKVALLKEGHKFDVAIREAEVILRETADPAIDGTITFFHERLSYLRSPGRISRTASGSEKNLIGWKKIIREENNVAAVKEALAYCQNAIKELERMKLEPKFNVKMIERLKTSIPKIDVFTEYRGEKTL